MDKTREWMTLSVFAEPADWPKLLGGPISKFLKDHVPADVSHYTIAFSRVGSWNIRFSYRLKKMPTAGPIVEQTLARFSEFFRRADLYPYSVITVPDERLFAEIPVNSVCHSLFQASYDPALSTLLSRVLIDGLQDSRCTDGELLNFAFILHVLAMKSFLRYHHPQSLLEIYLFLFGAQDDPLFHEIFKEHEQVLASIYFRFNTISVEELALYETWTVRWARRCDQLLRATRSAPNGQVAAVYTRICEAIRLQLLPGEKLPLLVLFCVSRLLKAHIQVNP